jgi:hypothetical protein
MGSSARLPAFGRRSSLTHYRCRITPERTSCASLARTTMHDMGMKSQRFPHRHETRSKAHLAAPNHATHEERPLGSNASSTNTECPIWLASCPGFGQRGQHLASVGFLVGAAGSNRNHECDSLPEHFIRGLLSSDPLRWDGDGLVESCKVVSTATDILGTAIPRLSDMNMNHVYVCDWYCAQMGYARLVCLWTGMRPAYRQQT